MSLALQSEPSAADRPVPVTSKQVEDLLEQVSTGSVVDFTVGIVRTVGRREFVSWTPVTLNAR